MNNGIFDRSVKLIGEDGLQRLFASRVLIIGVGGVGGYAVETDRKSVV